ncbi:hypothetical protein KIPB_009978, partial [Kipferlia bialata]|eukprot:g9978.t1
MGFLDLFSCCRGGKQSTGAAPITRDTDGSYPLIAALRERDIDAVLAILKNKKVDVLSQDGDSWTALHYASGYGETEVVQRLLRLGAKVNARDANGLTPLHVACEQNQTETCRLLIGRGADVDTQTNTLHTPLHIAAQHAYT